MCVHMFVSKRVPLKVFPGVATVDFCYSAKHFMPTAPLSQQYLTMQHVNFTNCTECPVPSTSLLQETTSTGSSLVITRLLQSTPMVTTIIIIAIVFLRASKIRNRLLAIISPHSSVPVSYTHRRAHATDSEIVRRLLHETKKILRTCLL